MVQSFNILTDAPTIVYPNGGEVFTENSISIQWIEPLNVSSSEAVWYEIFITDNFGNMGKPELLQVATVPYGNSTYSYYIDKNLKGSNCRVGVRAVNQNGIRSKISFSAGDFTITNEELPSPAVLEPYSGGIYFSYIPIILQHDSVLGRCSQRAFYQISYSSMSQNIDWTLMQSNIMVGSEPFDLDVRSVPTSSDYALKIEMVDNGHVSPALFIDNVTINNVSYFIIDTVPPKGSIKIINNSEYIKDRDFIVSLDCYDKSSGVKEYNIEEIAIDSENDIVKGPVASLTPLSSWDLRTDNDGVKLVRVRYKDYGDNIVSDSDSAIHFRTYKDLDNKEITSFLSDGESLYTAFKGDASSTDPPLLYKNQSLLYSLDGNATSMEFYNSVLYVAIRDPHENKGILQRESGGSMHSIVDNTNQYLDAEGTTLNSLYSSDSIINTMEVFDNKLFLGLQNGTLLSFNGSTMVTEYNNYVDIKSINLIKTDDNLLYIFYENSTEVLIMYKDSIGDYIFTTVETEN